MVKIEEIPGLEAWVCVNGERAVEYEPSVGPPKVEEVLPFTSTKYVQSISGANFTLHCVIGPDFNWRGNTERSHRAMGVFYKVDGNEDSYFDIIKMHRSKHVKQIQWHTEDHRGRLIKRTMHFANVKTIESNDKDRIKREKEFVSQLGAIEIIIKRMKWRKQYLQDETFADEESSSEEELSVDPRSISEESESDQSESEDEVETLEISEKALKGRAISNSTSFGPAWVAPKSIRRVETPAQNVSASFSSGLSSAGPKKPKWRWAYYVDHDVRPLAIFRFLYRSMDDLQKELIVPRLSLPSVEEEEAEGEPSIENLSMEQIMQLARERLEQKKGDVKIKTEKKPTLKREHGEIIDVKEEDSSHGARKSGQRRVFVDLTE